MPQAANSGLSGEATMKARPSPRGLRAIAGEILLAIAKAILPAPIPPSQRTAVNAILRKVDGEIDGILLHRHLYLMELLHRARTGRSLIEGSFEHGLSGIRLHPIARLTVFGRTRQHLRIDDASDTVLENDVDWYWGRFGTLNSAQMIRLYYKLQIGDAGRISEMMPVRPDKLAMDIEAVRTGLPHLMISTKAPDVR